MSDEQLRAIKRRLGEAGPSRWIREYDEETETFYIVTEGRRLEGSVIPVGGYTVGIEMAEEDAEFIAYAKQDVPLLIAEVERLQNALKSIQAICDASEYIRTNIDLSLIEDIAFDVLLEGN